MPDDIYNLKYIFDDDYLYQEIVGNYKLICYKCLKKYHKYDIFN